MESVEDSLRPSSQHKGDLLAPEGHRPWNKRHTGARGLGRMGKEQGEGGHTGLPLDREETDMAYRQMR